MGVGDGGAFRLINISGTSEEQKALWALVAEFHDVFSTELHSRPAAVPPLEFDVNYEEWHKPKNAGPARPTSAAGLEEQRLQVQKLLDAGVVSRVTTEHVKAYSQVLLVPKPDGSKRFCIDFRSLDKCIGHLSWPLPNINHMIQRLGRHRPKYFATFDMTKGYWQLELHPALRVVTAFITSFGLFYWNRIPMGLQPAASYFQYCIMVLILGNLAYQTCEAYIDDLIVHGKSFDEFFFS